MVIFNKVNYFLNLHFIFLYIYLKKLHYNILNKRRHLFILILVNDQNNCDVSFTQITIRNFNIHIIFVYWGNNDHVIAGIYSDLHSP